MRYDHFSMLPERAFRALGGRLVSLEGKGGGSTVQAPDYAPMAASSDYAAELGKQLGEEQLAEAKRQYDQNTAISEPIIKAQTGLMQQAYDQGNQNYNRMVEQGQPIQDQMKSVAMGGSYSDAQKAQQEEAASTAVADSRAGSNQQMQQLVRTGLRYGFSPSKLAALGSSAAATNAQSQVQAANGARTQKQSQQWGQMGDTYNTFAGLGSQAPTFYSAGTQAGNSAVGNQTSVSNSYMSGLSSGNGLIMNGQGLKMQGLGNILSSQTSLYGMGLQANANESAGLGNFLGQIGSAGIRQWSDRRLKTNIELVGKDEGTGLNLYEFEYKSLPGQRYRGVMADEVMKLYPDAVIETGTGYFAVNYDAIGIEMMEV